METVIALGTKMDSSKNEYKYKSNRKNIKYTLTHITFWKSFSSSDIAQGHASEMLIPPDKAADKIAEFTGWYNFSVFRGPFDLVW